MASDAEFRKAVSKEKAAFRKQLQSLLDKYRDKWVIFKDGQLIKVFESQDEAYATALELYGADEPFLVDVVQEEESQPLSFSIELGTAYVT